MINYADVFQWHSDRTPEKVVIHFEDKAITYRELNETATRFAISIRKNGGNPGEIVAILLYNRPEFYSASIGANKAGLAFLPINYRLAREELKYILLHSGAKFIVTENLFRKEIDQIRTSLTELRCCIIVDSSSSGEWQNFSDFMDDLEGKMSINYEPKPDEMHRLMYTSGTTAQPKGVVISYSNMWWKTFAHLIELQTTSEDIALVAGPLYHVGAFDLAAAHVLLAGGSLVILRKFDSKESFEAIQKHKVTVTWLAPSMLNMLLHSENIESFDLKSVRLIIDGGEKMPEPLVEKLLSTFPNARYADAYGLTETVSGDTFVPRKFVKKKLGSVGKPTLFVEMKIVDQNGNKVENGTDGEIIIRGPKVFKGYWKDDVATRNAIKRDSWFYTGDMGHLDDDGFLYITDRMKDMIKSGGENISSLEVERVLYQNSCVHEVAVVGIKDEKWGEIPVAYVVPKSNRSISPEALREFCNDKLAKFKIPKIFVLQKDPLPRNPSGKVLKHLLREKALDSRIIPTS